MPAAGSLIFVLMYFVATLYYRVVRRPIWRQKGLAGFSRRVQLWVQMAGIGSMAVAVFIFTEQHDLLINIASLLCLFGTIGTLVCLYMLKWMGLFWMDFQPGTGSAKQCVILQQTLDSGFAGGAEDNVLMFFALDFFDKCWKVRGKNHEKRRLNHMVSREKINCFVEIDP
jgi:hypothetical protein